MKDNEYDVEITRITKHKIKVKGSNKKQALREAKNFVKEIESGSNISHDALIQEQSRCKFLEKVVTGGK